MILIFISQQFCKAEYN